MDSCLCLEPFIFVILPFLILTENILSIIGFCWPAHVSTKDTSALKHSRALQSLPFELLVVFIGLQGRREVWSALLGQVNILMFGLSHYIHSILKIRYVESTLDKLL